ncbi:immunoglobulin-like domain-containing receptor 2 isoform X2 [Myripristis murdjan]|uniref:Immunoglobulin-like domain containing receptor 2 n=1 Tax=Myripristis murdjan TaxID=586833 RepID=A0A667ZD92_9TELE|nr:immunoglobulin-like domain-containing receptor 2 isoform X2 [Myripristis murdjan]
MNFYRLAIILGASAYVCDGVEVTVREKQRYAMLFQSVVLHCQYHTSSIQTPVVQWWYKSYCRDRTRESFTFSESLGISSPSPGTGSHVDCPDSSRTVRIVASAQGQSLTLSEHYKGRDIAIINKADLRIRELQWGDSGVYYCKVVIADDLEGRNEAQVELLVLGRTGEQDDILPEFDVEIMPEWVFVGSVVLGSILFLLFVGICWCQCCPHSCCCYVRCCCCPDTCCCPRHLYEAGKMAKSAQPTQVPMYPYYIPGVPTTMVPLAPSSHVDPKITSLPSVETNLAGAGSLSELSSLHDGGNADFRHTYQTVQMKALPPIEDLDDQSVLRVAPPTQSRRHRRDRSSHSDDELDRRWNPRSEHLQRKTLSSRGRTGSLDELEEFARSYGSRPRRAEPRDRAYDQNHVNYSPPRRFYGDGDEGWRRRSPSPLPPKRRDTWDSDRPARPSRCQPQGGREYDHTFLNNILESKARGRGGDRGAARVDDDSDTPSKGSSRGKGSDCYYSRSPSNRPEEDDPLPPYTEVERYRTERFRTEPPDTERYRTADPPMRPFCYARPPLGSSHTLHGGRDERDRNRNVSTALSRDSLIV